MKNSREKGKKCKKMYFSVTIHHYRIIWNSKYLTVTSLINILLYNGFILFMPYNPASMYV